MEWFFERTRSKKMLPGRVLLHEHTGERFRLLEEYGVTNLEELIRILVNRTKVRKVAFDTGIPEDYLVLLKREAGSYLARPFPLSGFPGIPFEYTEVLKSRGIRNTREFFEKVQSPDQQKEVSERTGIPRNRIREIHCLCDLSRISGVGGLFAKVLYDSGIRSTRELAETGAENLNERYLKVIEKFGYPPKPLSEEDIRYCLDSASLILEMNPEHP